MEGQHPKRDHWFSTFAFADMATIWDYIAQDNVTAADEVLVQFYHAVEDIVPFPLSYRNRPEILPGLRICPVGRYLILYRFSGDCVEVHRVIHAARDVRRVLEDGEA